MYDDDGRWIDDFGGTYYSNGKYLGNYNSYDEYAAEHCTYSQINIGVIRIIIGMFAGIVALIVQIIVYFYGIVKACAEYRRIHKNHEPLGYGK
jgi:hypothetical protein